MQSASIAADVKKLREETAELAQTSQQEAERAQRQGPFEESTPESARIRGEILRKKEELERKLAEKEQEIKNLESSLNRQFEANAQRVHGLEAALEESAKQIKTLTKEIEGIRTELGTIGENFTRISTAVQPRRDENHPPFLAKQSEKLTVLGLLGSTALFVGLWFFKKAAPVVITRVIQATPRAAGIRVIVVKSARELWRFLASPAGQQALRQGAQVVIARRR